MDNWFGNWVSTWFGAVDGGSPPPPPPPPPVYGAGRIFIAKRFGASPYARSGSGGSAKTPVVAFGDYCDRTGIAKRVGTHQGTPLVAIPRGLCDAGGNLITGETYLAKRFGTINGAPVVVPMCQFCGQPTSGSGSGSGSGGTGDDGLCCGWCARTDPSSNVGAPSTLQATVTVDCMGTRTVTLTRSTSINCSGDGNLTYTYQDDTPVSGGCAVCGPGSITWTDTTPSFFLEVSCESGPHSSSPSERSSKWTITGFWIDATTNTTWSTTRYDIILQGLAQNSSSSLPCATSGLANGKQHQMVCNPFYIFIKDCVVCTTASASGQNFGNTQCDNCDNSNITIEVTT